MAYLHRDIRAMGADDIAVVWNNEIERFQVYQVQSKGVYETDGSRRMQGRLIFTVQEKDGSYRPLDKRTLNMIARSIEMAHSIWAVPEHKRIEVLEKHERDQFDRRRQQMHLQHVEQIKELKQIGKRKTFS